MRPEFLPAAPGRLPRISVIVATWNAEATLQRCLDSFIKQSYPFRELIVVDGGSTDGTPEILRRNRSRIDVLISEPDRGIYDAWNKGVHAASGEWLTFVGADDVFAGPTVLADAAPHLAGARGARLAYGNAEVYDERGELISEVVAPWEGERRRFLQGVMRIPHPGMFHHRDLFRENGLFDPDFTVAGDYDLLLRELKDHEPLYLPEITTVAISASGVSRDFSRRFGILNEVRRARRRQGINVIPWSWYWLAVKSGLRWVLLTAGGPELTRTAVHRYRRLRTRIRWRR